MGEITLKPKVTFKVPIIAETITPDNFAGKSIEEIKKLETWEGNRKTTLGDLFEVIGSPGETPADTKIIIEGDVRKVRRIGYKMTDGQILIKGSVGMYLGEKMEGGKIIVEGDADSWVGAGMKGGQIEIKGNAGDYVGAPYRGDTKGMKKGTIIIHGNAGNEVGCWMRGGTIIVKGNAGLFSGIHMKKGTILVEGDCAGRCGAMMKGGKIAILGHVPSVLPSFTFEEIKKSFKVKGEKIKGPFYLFTGDLNENGAGKLYVSIEKNKHLQFYEKYLE